MAEEELHKTDADVSANDAADSNATVTDDVVVDAATDSEGDAVAVESETVTEEPQTDSEKKAEREEKRAEDNEKRAEEAAVVSEEEADDLSLDKIQAVLNSTIDEKDMSPQMRRMVKRQQENTKRVEESIKGTKANPSWFVPLFCAFMIVGLIWVVVFYMTAKYPIPGIGNWNLAVGFALIMIGFLMTVAWRSPSGWLIRIFFLRYLRVKRDRPQSILSLFTQRTTDFPILFSSSSLLPLLSSLRKRGHIEPLSVSFYAKIIARRNGRPARLCARPALTPVSACAAAYARPPQWSRTGTRLRRRAA